MTEFYGHQEPWKQWHAALAGEKMHHAWMLAGKRGVGKTHFAVEAAKLLVAEPAATAPDNHPDIVILNRLPKDDKEEKKRADGKPFDTKRNISVAQIREMQQRLTTRPTLGPRRAIIIDPSDDLEKGASNALLKSLEEPPIGTFFILVTHRPARLLPTIRSRCRIVRFPDVAIDDLDRLLSHKVPDADIATRQAAIMAAAGSPGIALEFVERDLGRMFTIMQRIMAEGDSDFMLRGQLTDSLGARPAREKILAAIDLARSVVCSALSSANRADYPAIVDAHAELVALAGQAPTYNFDPGLLIAETGSLLAAAAGPRDRGHV
ncbi:DNA polymerase III subunit delta' [Pontixanthobacter sp.]|uniref:DNA polymerase III subunit delta' n=1 Tax=Pontixanthobacter sp. TaxID=2792078 RepID=UPI003C7BD0E3